MTIKQGDSGVYEMTPEQKAKMKNFGKKNGLSEQKVQTQLAPKSPQQAVKPRTSPIVVQSPVQEVKPAPLPQQQPQPQPQQRLMQAPAQDCQTYFSYENEDSGSLEIDLIAFREKGLETRYLSLQFSGFDIRQNPPVPQDAFLNIDSKEEFERLKSFFAQLDWED